MSASKTFAMLLGVSLGAFVATVRAEGRAPSYKLIVNSSNDLTSVTREFVADAFLKKATSWPNSETIRPVDLAANSPVRRQFSEEVLHRTVAEVKGYWQQRIFSGRDVPPPEFETDEDVVKYVLKYDGAVGYVSSGANVDGARVATIR
jgi:ABC-type phosphate transport system substrate-binding protein